MITPNGGVFGRNPKFNNVTVDGNLTVNGDMALGDDITVTAYVSAANTVSVRFQNESGGTLDLGSGTLRVRVRKS